MPLPLSTAAGTILCLGVWDGVQELYASSHDVTTMLEHPNFDSACPCMHAHPCFLVHKSFTCLAYFCCVFLWQHVAVLGHTG
jgi:hypothetical protein